LARAEAVVAALAALGIEPSRLAARGFGASQPIADNSTPGGRALNRRIEIKAAEKQPQ
jgi:OOP family OmpA-OmpF porin